MGSKNYVPWLAAVCAMGMSSCSARKEMMLTSSDQLATNIGKRVLLVGRPVGSKADYALKTDFAIIAIDRAWDSKIFEPPQKEGPLLTVSGILDHEEAAVEPQTNEPIQSTTAPGETTPAQFVLREMKVIEVKR